MSTTAAMLQEYEHECATTRRVLERVPGDQLAWKPHQKSMSLGQLALHVAMIPGFISEWALKDVLEFSGDGGGAPEAKSVGEILSTHEESMKKTKAALGQIGDAGLGKMWEMKVKGGPTIMSMPKGALFRSVVLNHWYHHRGQLSVYLRLLNVPVPSIYGPSADDNPMAAAR
jgi:uncharacterized damage-inducible protein DinB